MPAGRPRQRDSAPRKLGAGGRRGRVLGTEGWLLTGRIPQIGFFLNADLTRADALNANFSNIDRWGSNDLTGARLPDATFNGGTFVPQEGSGRKVPLCGEKHKNELWILRDPADRPGTC